MKSSGLLYTYGSVESSWESLSNLHSWRAGRTQTSFPLGPRVQGYSPYWTAETEATRAGYEWAF